MGEVFFLLTRPLMGDPFTEYANHNIVRDLITDNGSL